MSVQFCPCFEVKELGLTAQFLAGRGTFWLEGTHQEDRFVVESFVICDLHSSSWREVLEFFCSSQVTDPRGARADCAERCSPGILGMHKTQGWACRMRGNRECVVRLCMRALPAVGACRPLALRRGTRTRNIPTREQEGWHHMHRSTHTHTHTESALHPCALACVTDTHRATARVASLAHKTKEACE